MSLSNDPEQGVLDARDEGKEELLVAGRPATASAVELFFRIAHCPVIDRYFESPQSVTDCSDIIAVQDQHTIRTRQVPEPWRGDIENAPILFVSSNPSIGDDEHALGSSPNEIVWDSHVNLFFGERWTRNGIYPVLPGGKRRNSWVRYWAFVRSHATRLLGRAALPGVDYAVTEVVHCKSKDQIGVAAATLQCVGRYLEDVLALSGSRVICVLGDAARLAFATRFGLPAKMGLTGPVILAQRERLLIFLPHPNARTKRSLEAFLSAQQIVRCRAWLENVSSAPLVTGASDALLGGPSTGSDDK